MKSAPLFRLQYLYGKKQLDRMQHLNRQNFLAQSPENGLAWMLAVHLNIGYWNPLPHSLST